MTDFLSHLVDRALDVAPVLERRRGSRFEPVRELMRPAEAIAEVNDVVDASRPAPPVLPHIEAPVPRATESPMPGVESIRPMQQVVERVVQPLEARQPDTPHIQPRYEDNRPKTMQETIVERRIETHTDHRITVSPTIQRHVEHHELVREIVQPAPRVDPVQQEAKSTPPQREVHVVRRVENSVPTASVAKPQQALSPRLAPQIQSPRAQRQAAVPAPSIESTPPAIHVTIGRIEIKATNAPAQPSRQRALTPKLSLDEYLKARSGGGR